MNKVERILKNTASTVATLLMVVGVAGSAFAGSKPSLQSVSGPRFSTASFCGRYVSSYTAIYQTTAGTPTTLTTPLSALEAAVAEPGPYLLNVRVSPFENVYPMVPAGGAINEMVLGPPQPVAV